MRRQIPSFIILLIGFVFGGITTITVGSQANIEPEDTGLPFAAIGLFSEVFQRVKSDYVDNVPDQMLFTNAIRGMVANLDPHSAYLSADEYQDIQISTSGNYIGIGIEVSLEDGVIKVVAPVDDTPAAEAGLMAGDMVVMIDDRPLNQGDLQDTVRRLRGDEGSTVRLTVAREGQENLINFNLQRRAIHISGIKYELLEPNVAYLRITQFTDGTAKEASDALASMKRSAPSSLQGLILDLRNNPGGVLDAAVEVSDLFLDEGEIVSAEGRVEDANFSMAAIRGQSLPGVSMVVLVNAGSASASEIVAGALQDHRRAKIMGQQTFGKGSVQTILPMSSGAALKLTTSKYFTPSGDSIHGIGITPDIILSETANDPSLLAEPRHNDSEIQSAIKELTALNSIERR